MVTNYPDPEMGSISLGKAGIKNFAYQLHNILEAKEVFVGTGTVTVSGWINEEIKTHSPKILTENFWELNKERQTIEIVY